MVLCRICLINTEIPISIDQTYQSYDLNTILLEIAGIVINHHDNSSKVLCPLCLSNLLKLYEFRLAMENSEKYWCERETENESLENVDCKNIVPIDFNASNFVGLHEMHENHIPEIHMQNSFNTSTINLNSNLNLNNNNDNGYFNSIFDSTQIQDENPNDEVSKEKTVPSKPTVVRYYCPVCFHLFQEKNFLPHVKTHQNENLFCQTCNQTFETNEEFVEDFINHVKGEKIYYCKFCEMKFYNNKLHQNHINDHANNPKMFKKCILCLKIFVNVRNYHKHMYSHKIKVRCNKCKAEYVHLGKFLKHHYKCHPDFICKECPNARFLEKKLYTEHFKKNHGKSKIKCSICQERFTDDKKLKEHMIKYHCPEKSPIVLLETININNYEEIMQSL